MLCKLSIKNIRKSIKDYSIYFLTLILGIAIFYMFNSIDSQQAMLEVSESTKEIIKLMIDMLSIVSVCVAVVLGFLIVYANNFLIKRRKREFGLYMTLGMGKRQISKILLFETIFIGLLSLVVGLVVGVFGSQLMSVLVAKLFEADMSEYQFVFSQAACVKTCMYFGVMYFAVMLFNTLTISKYKIIDLLTAMRKNEKVKMKNPVLCVIVFLVAVSMLGYAYYIVTGGIQLLDSVEKLLLPISLGIVSTFLIFWSLSGFLLKIVQSRKTIYLKGTNMFVLRQINNKINTTVASMTIICLMLFVTISVLSSALSLNNLLTKDLREMTPVDVNLYKTANLPENDKYSKAQIADSKVKISETLENNGFDTSLLTDVVEVTTFATSELVWKDTLGACLAEVKEQYPFLDYNIPETIIKASEYNKIAELYGISTYEVNENEYIMLCNYENMKVIRDKALKLNVTITINGNQYVPKYDECQDGYIYMSASHTNSGILIVSDSCNLPENMKERHYLLANYNAETDEERREIENMLVSDSHSELNQNLKASKIELDGITKIVTVETSKGLAALVTFIAMYIGIIFLIASVTILALKELTEHADNKQRYTILRKIGVDEKMIQHSLLKQIGIYFFVPLVLAMIHAIFGIKFALALASVQVNPDDLIVSIIPTVIVMIVVYGGYFWATYLGSKNIIRED